MFMQIKGNGPEKKYFYKWNMLSKYSSHVDNQCVHVLHESKQIGHLHVNAREDWV